MCRSLTLLPASARQLDKYRRKRELPQGEGGYECSVPGRGRQFTTKGGLSTHLQKSHQEGSYRDRTWDCPHCPRTFELELGLTKHLPLRGPNAAPSICCVCNAFFPGEASARMHVNKQRPAKALPLPIVCLYCPPHDAPTFFQRHAFSLRRFRCRVYA